MDATTQKPTASWWRAYDRAIQRGDYERASQMIAMTREEKATFNPSKKKES